MSAFTVELKNQPGELARLCEAMAAKGVNIILCGTTRGDTGMIALIADDEGAARTALEATGFGFTERQALTVRMENRPGAGAATLRKLADANVNMELLLPVRISEEQFFAVLCVDNVDAARNALADQLVND